MMIIYSHFSQAPFPMGSDNIRQSLFHLAGS